MDKARKNDAIHAAADRMAANYKSSQIPMYGDALRMPSRNAVIEILRDCQKLIFPSTMATETCSSCRPSSTVRF